METRCQTTGTSFPFELSISVVFPLFAIWSLVGWRYLKYDFRKAGFTDKNELNGPFLQTGMNF